MNAAREPEVLYVNGKWLAQQQSGTQRYATEIVRRMADKPDSKRLHLIVPKDAKLPPWTAQFTVHRSRLRGTLFEQVALPLRTAGGHLYSMAGPAPILKRNQTVVMHDAMPFRHPETYRRRVVLWYRIMYRVLGRRAQRLVTVSEFSRRELSELLHVEAERIVVAPCGSDHVLNLDDSTSLSVPFASQSYALLVGNQAPHKNISATAEALAAADIPTVVVGGSVNGFFRGQPNRGDSRLLYLGRISDGDLARLYADAGVLVQPSSYEGFGIPIVEAGRFGCPSVIADGSALTEVAAFGGAAFRRLDHAGCVAAVAAILGHSGMRARLGDLAAERAAQFEWGASADIIFGDTAVRPEERQCRILHVTETFSAGTGVAMTHFARQVGPHGVDNYLAAYDRGSGLVNELGEGSPFVNAQLAGPGLPSLTRAILAQVRAVRPDVVHVHSSMAGALVRVLSYVRPLPPVVYSPHCFAFERVDVSPAQRAAYRLVERILARRTAAFVCVSPHEANLATRLHPGAHVAEVLNIIDDGGPGGTHTVGAARHTRLNAHVDGGLVCVGRIAPQKDPAEFARIVAAVRRLHPDLPASWIGDGHDPASRLALQSRGVTVTGWLSHAAVASELLRHRVYIHTALWEAAVPIAVFQAMRAGLPVVVRRHASYWNLLPDEWMFNDPEDGAALVANLLDGDHRDDRIEAQRKLLEQLGDHRSGTVLAATYMHVTRMRDG